MLLFYMFEKNSNSTVTTSNFTLQDTLDNCQKSLTDSYVECSCSASKARNDLTMVSLERENVP